MMLLFTSVTSTSTAGARPRPAGSTGITLLHQNLALAPDASLEIQFHPAEPLGDSTVSVLAYRPITLRDSLKKAIDHRLSGFLDRVDLDPATVVPDAEGNVTITVPTESVTSTAPALRLAQAGLYPLAVRIFDSSGEPRDDLVTFVARQPSADAAPAGRVGLAVLASVTAPPRLTATDTLPAEITTALDDLVRYEPGVHLSLAISPEILGRLDEVRLNALRAALANSVIISQPRVPFDPSTATSSGLQDRFTELLVDGEQAVTATGGLPTTNRSAWYAPSGLSNDGALMLRDLGVRLLVLSADSYLAAEGNIGDLTDYSQLFETVLADGDATGQDSERTCESSDVICMPTAVIDPLMSARLLDPSLSPEQAALYTAADIVVYREQFAESLSASNRHALLLGPNGEGVPDAQRVSRTVAMVGATDAVQFITLDQLEQSSSALLTDGRPVELHLPQPTPFDLTARSRSLADVALAVATVSSMLVDDGGRTDTWNNTISNLYSSSITDTQVDRSIQDINGQLAAIRACVVAPGTYTFTLTGSSTNLPLRIGNRCAEPLKVMVRLEAAADKMEFPAVPTERSLAALETSDIKVPVTARTNGTFTVTLDLLTPAGEAKITDTVTLKARVNTLTGLPQLLTGAGLLILLTWWMRNLRRSRRQQRAAAIASAVTDSAHPEGTAARTGLPPTS